MTLGEVRRSGLTSQVLAILAQEPENAQQNWEAALGGETGKLNGLAQDIFQVIHEAKPGNEETAIAFWWHALREVPKDLSSCSKAKKVGVDKDLIGEILRYSYNEIDKQEAKLVVSSLIIMGTVDSVAGIVPGLVGGSVGLAARFLDQAVINQEMVIAGYIALGVLTLAKTWQDKKNLQERRPSTAGLAAFLQALGVKNPHLAAITERGITFGLSAIALWGSNEIDPAGGMAYLLTQTGILAATAIIDSRTKPIKMLSNL